jgi:hypothetical protein
VRTGLLATTVLLAALLLAPGAEARWFGANLHRSANSEATCQDFIFTQRVSSCSWFTSGTPPDDARETMIVPGTGVITRVRIKVGKRSGPMRVSTAETLRKKNSRESACCTGRRQTRILHPRRRHTTTYRVHIPVRVHYNRRSKIYSYDTIFLTMQNAHTPIPAHGGGGNCSGGWFPRLRPHRENFSGPYSQCGYTILLRAKWHAR